MAVGLVLALSTWGNGGNKANNAARTSGNVTIEGLVRDIACPIENKEATATRFNLQCALQCARQGSPLIILTKTGLMYIPISTDMPDKDQREQLMPFIGRFVRVTGKVYERAGTRAIAIEDIREMKGVHLDSNAQ
jgi:hypothetical protein